MPPLKRQRLSTTIDPEDDLQERRARNDSQLKSRFESIFEKYSKDFEGIGDEIDIRTGEIVVNNGHVLGMTNERDVGDPKTSNEELESGYYSEDEDIQGLDCYNEPRGTELEPVDLTVVAVMSQAALTWHSDDDADSLMGDIEVERQEDKVAIDSRGLSISDSEEDELANSEFNWMNPRHIRAVAHDRWHVRKQQLESLDEPSIDPAWRAPPLLKPQPSLQATRTALAPSIGVDEEESDNALCEISMWAPEEMKGRERISRKQHNQSYQSLHPKEMDFYPETLSDSNSPEKLSKPHFWAQEEENRLRHLKVNKAMRWREMEPYFPHRSEQSIALHWSNMIRHKRADPTAEFTAHTKPRLPSALPSAEPFQAPESGSRHSWLPESSSRQTDAEFMEQLPKSITPVLVDHISSMDVPIASMAEISNDHLVQPYESLQSAGTGRNLTSLQVSSKAIQPLFAGNLQQNKGQLNDRGQLSQSCKDELAKEDQMNSSITHVMSIAQSCELDEEIAQLQVGIEKENTQIEELLRQTDRALATAAAAVNARHSSSDTSEQEKYRLDRQSITASTEPRLVENGPTVRKRKCAQNFKAHDFDVVSRLDRRGDDDQSKPFEDEPTLSTMSQKISREKHLPRVAVLVTSVSPSPTDGPSLLPRVNHSLSAECFVGHEALTTPPAACDAKPLHEFDRTSAKAHAICVAIPIATVHTSKDHIPTVDMGVDKLKPTSRTDNRDSNTTSPGEMPCQLFHQSTSPAGVENEQRALIPDPHLNNPTKNYALPNRAQSDLEDPLVSEIPDSQPQSTSYAAIESPTRQGKKVVKKSATASQPFDSAAQFRLGSPKTRRKKPVKVAVADSFSWISEAMLDCSEDELSFM